MARIAGLEVTDVNGSYAAESRTGRSRETRREMTGRSGAPVSEVPAIAAEGATVVLDGTTLLAPTTFEVMSGEFWCLTGSNGSGKTTLLRAFLGSRRLTDGAVLVRGETVDMTRPRDRRLTASLVEPIPVARDMTLREQVTLVAASWFGNTTETAERSGEIIGRLGLTALGTRFPSQLSSGQLQLFHLALTLVRPADVILLDEPERHLDTTRVDLVTALLAERAEQGTSFLVATHEAAVMEACGGLIELG